jgi:hypothetical protein
MENERLIDDAGKTYMDALRRQRLVFVIDFDALSGSI